jgi:hypothetical protein
VDVPIKALQEFSSFKNSFKKFDREKLNIFLAIQRLAVAPQILVSFFTLIYIWGLLHLTLVINEKKRETLKLKKHMLMKLIYVGGFEPMNFDFLILI